MAQPSKKRRSPASAAAESITPMMQQYLAVKKAYPGCLVFFRMGDFYELFFEDAETASRELELTLTSRNKSDDNPIPMAGVPHHALNGYLNRLIERGYRVAVCDQVEDPKTAKGIVRREVTRVVTPGMLADPECLDALEPNYLAAINGRDGQYGLAFVDISTGELSAGDLGSLDEALTELVRMGAREL